MTDFFVSYNRADRGWAEWIAWQLEDGGYSTTLQAWDFHPGSNFVLDMQRATREADRTIAVLSPIMLQHSILSPNGRRPCTGSDWREGHFGARSRPHL
jgi:hypothetical protein